MIIDYENNKIEKFFSNWEHTAKKCGFETAKLIKKRFEQIKASADIDVFYSLGIGKPHLLKGDMTGCLGISITGNLRLILIIKDYSPKKSLTEIFKTNHLTIKGVCDYHGDKYEWIIP